MGIEKEMANVFFLDFGNYQKTKLEDLKKLPEELTIIPQLALNVSLLDVPDGTFSEAIDYLNEITSENIPLTLVSLKIMII